MPPPPRQYLLGPERQLTLEGRAEPLHVQAVPERQLTLEGRAEPLHVQAVPEPESPSAAGGAAGDPRQSRLQLGPHGSSRQLALALYPEERRNPKAAVVLDDLEAVVEDWPAFWAPLEAELEEVRRAGRYKHLESVKLLALGRWIHGLRHDAIEEEGKSRAGEDAGCPLQCPARGLVDVLGCKGATPRGRLRRAFRVLAELRERGEILRHPRLVTLTWATRHRPPEMRLREVEDVDGDGKEISRRRVDVHGVIYFRWSGVRFIQRRGDRYEYRVISRARSERTVKVIAGPNAAVLTTFSRQIRRVAKRLRRARPPSPAPARAERIPSQTSQPLGYPLIGSPMEGGAPAPRPSQPHETGGAHAPVAAQSGAAPSSTTPADRPTNARRPTAQGSSTEDKGPPPLGRRASGRFAAHAAENARLDALTAPELEAEKRALAAGWALPALREEAERCWRNVVWEPALDVRGRPVYLGDGEQRMRPRARPITTAQDWRPGAWAVASEDGGRAQLRRLFAPVALLLAARIRRGEPPPEPPWTAPPKRLRGRYDTGLHAFGRGRCKGCGETAPLMYESDVFGRMVPLEHCERCWDGGRWRAPEPESPSRPPRPATPPAVGLAEVLRRAVAAERKKR